MGFKKILSQKLSQGGCDKKFIAIPTVKRHLSHVTEVGGNTIPPLLPAASSLDQRTGTLKGTPDARPTAVSWSNANRVRRKAAGQPPGGARLPPRAPSGAALARRYTSNQLNMHSSEIP